MKKIGLGLIAILGVGVLYYFTVGSKQIAKEMQAQVHKELHSAQTNGFKISKQSQTQKSDHFILTFDAPKKIAPFLQAQGIHLTSQDAEDLKGLSLEMYIAYLADSYSAVSMDIYPLQLPDELIHAAHTEEEKHLITQITKLLQERKILIHLDINKLGTAFKGYAKDFSEHFKGQALSTFTLKGMTFSGTLKNHALHSLTQDLVMAHIEIENTMKLTLEGIKSDYTLTGKSIYDYSSLYTIQNISVLVANNHAEINFKKIRITSISHLENKLASGRMHLQSQYIEIKDKNRVTRLEDVNIDSNASNLDISAFETLQSATTLTDEQRNTLLQQLISKGVILNLTDISAQNIIDNNQTLGAVHLSAHLDIDPSLNIQSANKNPLHALDAIDASVKVILSPALLGYLAQQPQVMLAMMMFQPQEVNGQKVYSIELKDGKATLNGKALN